MRTKRFCVLSSNTALTCFAAVSLVVVALLCGSAYAQETGGTVRGTVTDPSGAAIPNASVELSGSLLPRSFITTTSDAGIYQFAQVPPGTGYLVAVTAQGFRLAKVGGINVEIGKASTLDLKLEVGQVAEVVEVTAEANMVDTQSSSSAVTIDKSFFDVLPKGRSFYDLIQIAPGARAEGKSDGYQVDGASGAENTYFLNGMEMEDIQGGTLASQNHIPVEMVQQVQVKNGIMDAEYGGAMGGVISAVTRSGQNNFHGEAGFYWSGDSVAAGPHPVLQLNPNDDNLYKYYPVLKDSFSNWNPVVTVGGPLVKNKLFFFAGYMPEMISTTRLVNFTTGENGTYSNKFTQQFLNTRLDYVPFEKLRVNMSWVWNPNKNTGALPSNLGTDAFSNNWAQQGNFNGNQILAGQIDYMATSKLLFSFRGGYSYSGFNNMYGIPAVTAVYYSGASTTLPPPSLQAPNGWIHQAVSANLFDQNKRTNLNADVSYIANWHGQHSIKGGWQMNRLANDVNDNTYPFGYYRYYWGRTYHCQTQVCAETGAYGYYRYRVLGTIGNASSNNQGMFLQDNWRVNRRLSINMGLRTEHEFVPSFSSNKSIPSQAILFDWPQKMSPRIGVAIDPTGAGKQRIYAGFGYFYDIMKYSLPRGSFGGDVWKEYFYTLDDPNLVTTNQGFAPNPSALPGKLIETVDYRIPSNDPSQHLIDPNLKPMKQRMIDLGYEYSIGPSLVASARYTDRRLLQVIEDIGYVSPDGEVYNIANPGFGTVANAQNWLNWMGPGIPTTPKAVRDYDAVEFRLDKRFSKSYQFSFSYTYSRLYGNFSGLASTDEAGGFFGTGPGRDNPNNSRYFDQPWIYGNSQGKNVQGLLPTDRPHTFKFFGAYTLKTRLGSTTFSPYFQMYSGTPMTTEAQVIDTQGWVFMNGRGDLGRSPFFFQTDANIMHEVAPLRNHESFRVRFEVTAFNLLNNDTVLNKYNLYDHVVDSPVTVDSIASIFSQGINVPSLMQAQGIRVDPQYLKPDIFQSPRSLRLQLKFFF
jgi:carboxypeptidase family protein/TonB-dependent receptor-like protein